MYIKHESASKENYEKLAMDYYNESERVNGAVSRSLRRVSIKRLLRSYETPKSSSKMLKKVDINYANALVNLELAFNPSSKIISLYDENNFILAHTTVGIMLNTENDEIMPFISDIIIKNSDDLFDAAEDGIYIKYSIFQKMIKYYEKLVLKFYPTAEKYTVLTYAADGDFWLALEDNGYEIGNLVKDAPKGAIRFTKLVRDNKRSNTYGRDLTLK